MSSQSSPSSDNSQTPAVRTFQMDGSSQGSLASAVNLFRGDVNLSQTLFTLPGRAQGNTLDVAVTVQYQSNVKHSATTWNAEAPTGVLGLGWGLPLTWIEAADGGSPVAATRSYTLFDNGSPNGLYEQPLVPALFAMDAALAPGLHDGGSVPAPVRAQFLAHGLALSASTRVTGTGPWLLDDDELQQQFQLDVQADALVARDGGQLYQLQNYQFWKVIYYPQYERWLIVSEQGVRRSLGGRSADTDKGFATSVGNSVGWSVWWTDGGDQPVWSGASSQTDRQVQVARSWYLTELRDRFGSTVLFSYNAGERDARGILPVVEQQVGAGGKPYTKAIYLARVVDSYGRTLDFHYADKEWGAAPAAPREYHDPHASTPGNAPGPWQDRYETRYLSSLSVDDAAGARMFSFQFVYAPRPGSPVANVTDSIGRLAGDTYKRYLTAIIQYNQDGVASPGLAFEYDLGADTVDGQPGALLAMTTPQGGVARYAYRNDSLLLAERTAVAIRPDAVPDGATPRVFFGGDYAVVCFYNQNSLQLSLQVYTWNGTWLHWQPGPDSALIDSGGLALSSLNVQASADFMTLRFHRTSGELAVYVFQRDTARPGQWMPAVLDGTTTGPNQPTLRYATSNTPPQVHAGNTFFVVAQMDASTLKGSYEVITWRWSTQRWTRATVNTAQYAWLTAAAEYFVVLDRSGTLQLCWLDGQLHWQQSAAVQINGLVSDALDTVALTPSAGLLVVSNLTSNNSQQNTYRQWVVEWDASHAITLSGFGPYTDWFGSGNAPLGWHPTIVQGAMIATNGNLLRRDGGRWSENTALSLPNPPSGVSIRHAYSASYAIRVVAPTTGTGTAEAVVVAFDPSLPDPWVAPTPIAQPLPYQDTPARNWPSANSDDWAVIGPWLYRRGTATSWAAVVSAPATANLDTVVSGSGAGNQYDSASLVDSAPGFLAYTVDHDSTQSVQALIISNGDLASAPVAFADEKLADPGAGGLGGAGVAAAGPGLFVSFPAQYPNIDQAQSLFLHRYAGYAVSGPIQHHAVIRVEMDDGFGDAIPTAFDPDPATAGADASGTIIKYYQNTVYPGAHSPAQAIDGHVVSRYLNGLGDRSGGNYYDMLDGLLDRTDTYTADGRLVASSSTAWSVLEQVASSPTDAAAPAVQLRGGWVNANRQVEMSDGVSTVTTLAFVSAGLSLPYTGQPVSRTRNNHAGDGSEETFSSVTRYAVEFPVYQALVAIHALTDDAQVYSLHDAAGAVLPVSATATTYTGWASEAGEGVQSPAPEAGFSLVASSTIAFPFARYQPGDIPDGWQLSARTTARTPHGQESANVDALGNPSSTLFDCNEELAIARIANASPGGCAYLGFQAYEAADAWTLSGVVYDADDAYTGTRSALLPGGAAASIATRIVPDRLETQLLGCRYRTAADFVGDGSGLTVTVTAEGSAAQTVHLPWSTTDATWRYVILPIPLPAGLQGVALSLAVTNTSDHDVHLDSLLLTPLVTAVTVRSFDPDSQQIASAMDASGRTSRTYYDRSYRASVSVGSAGRVREISSSFLSRQGAADGAFAPQSPNAELTLHSTGGGVLESFRDGALWAERWVPDTPHSWQQGDGALRHAGTATDALVWSQQTQDTFAVYVEVQAGAGAQFSVGAGDVRVAWTGNGWAATQGSHSWTPLAQPPQVASSCLLVVGEGVVLFFGDGQLLFSERVSPVGRQVAISAGGTAVTLRNLTAVTGVRLGLSYNDAGGRQRQVHQLHGNDSLLCQLVFDALDRQLATTKSAPGAFGSGAGLPTLQYRPGFLDVEAFLAATGGDWAMHGDVADYYAGQTEDGVTRCNDAGYPYWGARYEPSPRSLKVETSRPGKASAINLQVPAPQRQTTQFAFGCNPVNGTDLPAAQYAQTQVTSAVKTVSTQLTDQMGQQVATRYLDDAGTLVSQSRGLRSYTAPASGPVASLLQQLPNALTDGPQSGNAGFVRQTVANALQETTLLTDPDSGDTGFVFDAVGNLRFVRPAMDPDENWFIYYRYDAIGRLLEEGTLQAEWKLAELQAAANQPGWPTAGTDGATAKVLTRYDGPADDPSLIGMKWVTTTVNPAPALAPDAGDIQVVETFGYDVAGNMVSVRQEVSGAVTASGTLGYAYDQLGGVVQLTLPEGAPVAALFYRYDDQGNVVAIGRQPGADDIGHFAYSADNQPVSQVTGNWARSITYGSTGWIDALTTAATDGSHQQLGFVFDYDADGAMSGRAVTFAFNPFALQYDDTFGYDAQRRLAYAKGASDTQYPQYDPDGNLWQSAHAGQVSQFAYEPGNNRLASIALGGGMSGNVVHNARGQVIATPGRTLSYDSTTGMTTLVDTDAASVRLAYGGIQQRVVKQTVGGAAEVQFMGAGQATVASLVDGQWAITVHGPTGPLAWIADRTYYLITDTTQSVWGVVADGELVGARTYLPFGAMSVVHGHDPVPYAYQGQVWDDAFALYDFHTRLYDPLLGRFLTPDPQRQFASPYVFANNSPLIIIDPTGEISIWAQVGIGVAMVAITAVGIGLTLFTGGASDAAAASADAALLAAAGAAEGAAAAETGAAAGVVAAEVAADAGATAAVGAGVEGGSAAAGAAASAEVGAGVTTASAAPTTAGFTWSGYGIGITGSTLTSAGTSGLTYDIQHGRDFTAKGFFEAVGIGAASGFASGAIGGALSPLTAGLKNLTGIGGALARAAGGAATGAAGSALSSDLKTVLTNLAQHEGRQGIVTYRAKNHLSD